MLTASCHCGAVRLEIPRRPRKLTECNCSICRRYGALWAYYRRKAITVTAARGALASYKRRPDGTLEFYHCKNCGCVTHHERSAKRRDRSETLGVNMRNIDEPTVISMIPIKMLDGDATWKVLEESVSPNLFHSPVRRV